MKRHLFVSHFQFLCPDLGWRKKSNHFEDIAYYLVVISLGCELFRQTTYISTFSIHGICVYFIFTFLTNTESSKTPPKKTAVSAEYPFAQHLDQHSPKLYQHGACILNCNPPCLATFFSLSPRLNTSVPESSVALNLAQVNFIYQVKNSFYVPGDTETWIIGYTIVGCFYFLLSGEAPCPAPK